MKKKFLMIPVLATLVLTGCGKKNQPQPEPQPQDEVVDVNSEEGKAKINSLFDKSIDLYSNPANFRALHLSGEAKDVNLVLDAKVVETTKFGLNEVNFAFTNVNAKAEAYARVDNERKVEGMVQASDIKGHHQVKAGVFQPAEGQKEGEEPVGVFFDSQFDIAPSKVNAYFKDGKGYFDLTDEGIRTTLSNANEFANKGYAAFEAAQAIIDELNKPQQTQPQPQPLREGEQQQPQQQGLDLNAMLDQYTDPSRKFQTVLEQNGFVIPEEDYQPAKAEEVAEAKADVKEFVDNVLPSLGSAQIMTITELVAGGYQIDINLNKQKVVDALPFVQDYVEAKKAEEESQQQVQAQPASIRRDGEQQQPVQVVEQSWADQFNEIVDKFDINAKLVLDSQGYLRDVSLNYDLSAGVEGFRWSFFGLQGSADINLDLSGKLSASIQYNDEVSFALPEDLDSYVLVNFKD